MIAVPTAPTASVIAKPVVSARRRSAAPEVPPSSGASSSSSPGAPNTQLFVPCSEPALKTTVARLEKDSSSASSP
jgi:hypothetical protein